MAIEIEAAMQHWYNKINPQQKPIARITVIFVAAIIILTLLSRGVAGVMVAKVQLTKPYNDKIKQTIELTAIVSTAKDNDIVSDVSLTLTDVLITEGQLVEVGTPIAVADMKLVKEQLAQEQLTLDKLKLDLKQAQRGANTSDSMTDVQNKLIWAEQDYESQKQKCTSALESAQHGLEVALAAQREAQRELADVSSGDAAGKFYQTVHERDLAASNVYSIQQNLYNLERMVTPSTPYTAELEELRAALSEAQSVLSGKQSEVESLSTMAKEKQKSAEKNLTAANEGVYAAEQNVTQVTQNNTDALRNAQRAIDTAKQAIDTAAKQSADNSQAAIDANAKGAITQRDIKLNISKCEDTIKACQAIPADGRILSTYAGKALSVTQGGTVTADAVLATVSSTEAGYKAVAEVSTKLKLESGMTGTVLSNDLFASNTGENAATLSALKPTLDPNSVEAVFAIDGNYELGESVQIEIVQKTSPTGICIPLSALHQNSSGFFIYTVTQEGGVLGIQDVVRMVMVEVTARSNEAVAVKGAVSVGDKVVASSSKPLADGDVVREQAI